MPAEKPIPPKRRSSRATAGNPVATPTLAEQIGAIMARYDAAGMGRRMSSWNPPSSGPNTVTEGLGKIRDRSRDSARNEWVGQAAPQRWATTLIGVGITPRFDAIENEDDRALVTDLIDEWANVCDADGVDTYYGQQSLATLTWFIGGECFGRERYRRADSGLPINMQMQVLEGDMCPHTLNADAWPGMPVGNSIRQGIERNRIGQRIAYWFYKNHPGDRQMNPWTQADANLFVRVLAGEVRHLFEPKRPGQLRGVPDQAPVMTHLRTILDFNDAVAERQRLANLLVAVIKKQGNSMYGQGQSDPVTGAAIGGAGAILPPTLEPGAVIELMPGEEMQQVNPPEAGTMFSEYMRTQHLYSAAGQNLPYEILTGDIANISDRTLRVVITEWRRFAEQRQHQRIIPQWCRPIIRSALQQAALDGSIPLRLLPLALKATHQPHGWAYIHPVQDVQAKVLEVANNLRSHSSVITERGDDPAKVAAEIKRDKAAGFAVEQKGVVTPNSTVQQGEQQQQGGQQPSNTTAVERLANRLVADGRTTVEQFKTLIAAIESKTPAAPAPAPSFTAHIHIPAQNISVEAPNVTVEAPNVSVTNDVPAPVVNVEAPNVSVTNDVKSPLVNVVNEVSVDLPDRETSSTIQRDGKGNIVNVTQIERTVK